MHRQTLGGSELVVVLKRPKQRKHKDSFFAPVFWIMCAGTFGILERCMNYIDFTNYFEIITTQTAFLIVQVEPRTTSCSVLRRLLSIDNDST